MQLYLSTQDCANKALNLLTQHLKALNLDREEGTNSNWVASCYLPRFTIFPALTTTFKPLNSTVSHSGLIRNMGVLPHLLLLLNEEMAAVAGEPFPRFILCTSYILNGRLIRWSFIPWFPHKDVYQVYLIRQWVGPSCGNWRTWIWGWSYSLGNGGCPKYYVLTQD